jgi:hypothetical protein
MDVLAHDIMRYEMLSEQDEYKALASVLQGNESEDYEFELQEVQLQPLPELQEDVNKTYSLFYNVVCLNFSIVCF